MELFFCIAIVQKLNRDRKFLFIFGEIVQELLGPTDSSVLLFVRFVSTAEVLFSLRLVWLLCIMQNIMGTELGGRIGNAPSKNQLCVDLDPKEGVEPGIVIYGGFWVLACHYVIMKHQKAK